jgi:amidase
MTACEIADAVRTGKISAIDTVRAHLARIDAFDPRLNAFRTVRRDAALAEAAAVDARPDRSELPLAGVPIAVKDNMAVTGEQVRHGSNATDPTPSPTDDEIVRRLRSAGAVIIGITAMPELAAWGFTSSAAFGVTRNPWDHELDPGGSTGGGAAAVATAMAALAVGTDGGGSVRIPAAYCGLVGLKPGRGLLPLPGGVDEHWCGLSVTGPIARTAADAALAFAVLRGETAVPLETPSALRVAVSRRSPNPFGRADDRQRAAIDRAVDRLHAVGHLTVRANPPYPRTVIQRWSRRWLAGVALDAHELGVDEEKLEPRTRAMIRKGRRLVRSRGPRAIDQDAWGVRATRWLTSYDVLLTPTVATGPPPAGAFDGAGYLRTFLAAGRTVPFTPSWNLAGLPAVSVPVGMHDGLPLAVQLIGAPGTEPRLLAIAQQLHVHE